MNENPIDDAHILPNITQTRTDERSTRLNLRQIAAYEPVIPHDVVKYLIQRQGINAPSELTVRTMTVATEKFIHDILNDAMLNAQIQGGLRLNSAGEEEKTTLTRENLQKVLNDRGMLN